MTVILVDVTSRTINVENVEHVFNFESDLKLEN